MKVYIVTNAELGWDNIVDVFKHHDTAKQEYGNEQYHIIEQTINNTKPKKVKIDFKVIDENSKLYKKDNFLFDSLKITHGIFYDDNSIASSNFIANQYIMFCKEKGFDISNNEIYIVESFDEESKAYYMLYTKQEVEETDDYFCDYLENKGIDAF